MANLKKGKDLMIGAVIGGVLGAFTALLLAPKSGRELRSDIAEQYHAASEKTQRVVGTVSQKTQQITQSISNHTSGWIGKAKETASQVAEGVRSWKGSDKTEELPQEEESTEAEAAEDLVILGNR